MGSWKPARKPEWLQMEAGGELLLHMSEEDTLHALNATARVIWSLCDGKHSPEDMEAALRASFQIPPEANVRADVERTLQTFVKKGLVIGPTS